MINVQPPINLIYQGQQYKFMTYKKAQIAGLDLILALMLFFMVIILFAVLWDLVQYNVRTSADADVIAIQVANRLLGSPGYPYDWNASNVELIGLSSERGVMDQAKLENLLELMSLDYEKVRELLGLGPYQLYINMTYIDGSPVIINGNPAEGGIPPTNATDVSSVRRTAIYGEIVVHNNSITFIFDSSGSMEWFSTSLGYKNGNLTNSWVNVYNVTLPASPTSSFDFVIEPNTTSNYHAKINVTSPSGIKYGCSTGSHCSNCGTGCAADYGSGVMHMNLTSSRWEAGTWKVYARKVDESNSPSYNYSVSLSYDLMVQTPPRRVDAAKTATKNFVDVIANESEGIDEMSLFTLANTSSSCPTDPCSNCANLSRGFTSGDYTPIKNAVNNIIANGGTPLDQTLRRAADYTNASATRKHNMIIIVSDGSETCGGNVVNAANYAVNTKKIQKICTVGFAQGSTGESQLRQAASIGNCQYYSARNEEELELALRQIYFGQLEKQKVLLNVVVWR